MRLDSGLATLCSAQVWLDEISDAAWLVRAEVEDQVHDFGAMSP